MQQNGAKVGANLNKAYNDTRYKVSRYIYGEKPVEVVQSNIPPMPPTICYQAQFDVMCFDRPKPELHLNLVAVHGEHNYNYQDFLPNDVQTNASSQMQGYNVGAALNNWKYLLDSFCVGNYRIFGTREYFW